VTTIRESREGVPVGDGGVTFSSPLSSEWEYDMARPGPASIAKRQRERQKQQKQREKAERRAARKEEKKLRAQEAAESRDGEVDPDLVGIRLGPQPPAIE
jgi:hypothetical protein